MVILAVAGKLEAVELNCEKIESYKRFANCCYLNEATVITEANVTIPGLRNLDVRAVLFTGNEKIKFLPVNVHRKFPNLETYMATDAAVKVISFLQFARLSKLKMLDLASNQIEFIPDDCFHGLTNLYKINLSMKASTHSSEK